MRGVLYPILAATLAAGTVPALGADGLALRRVLLSTGGVGYFEHEASVAGPAVMTVTVRRDQVDDVLKSLVVYDPAGGVGTIDLPGAEPLAAVFRELPFPPEALVSPAALLNALKGAEVRTTGARALSGRLLSVTDDVQTMPDGGTIVRNRISLMTESGLAQFLLEDAGTLAFADPVLESQVGRALAAMAALGSKDRRTLTIRLGDGTERRVRVGFVAAAPLWKATYRLTLPDSGSAAGELQGWAVIENLSGDDWTDVELTVVSGNPVTFRQNLYEANFVERPLVPVEVMGRVLPGPDERAIAPAAKAAPAPRPRERGLAFAAPDVAAGAIAGALAPAPAMPAPAEAAVIAAESADATTQVVFRYPRPVSLANGASMMMPIVARAVPAERIALYQPRSQPRHPLASARLVNDGDSGLPPGVLTLYERSGPGGAVAFVGDARLSALPPGEDRFLSFAIDQKVVVDRAERPRRTIGSVSLVDGVLTTAVTESLTTTYTVAGPAREARDVILEHPRRPGWSLVEPRQNVSTTSDSYRIPVAVAAGATVTVPVTLEQPKSERLAVMDLAPERVAAFAASGDLPPAIREAFAQLARLRAEATDSAARVATLTEDRAAVVQDQERMRQNLTTLPRDSDLHKRTLARMGEAETRLERLAEDIAKAKRAADTAENAVTTYLRSLRL